ncbi:MAG: LytTR family transcriptional regulator [Reichenbachiella sp.]
MKLLKHFAFWTVVIVALSLIFGRSYHSVTESFYFVTILTPVLIVTAYFFNYYLVPNYLLQKRYGKFTLYCFYLFIVSLNLEMIVIGVAYLVLAELDYANMNPVTTDISTLTVTLYFVVLTLSFIRLARLYFNSETEKYKANEQLSKDKTEYLIIRENRSNKQLRLSQILYIESLADYIQIHLEMDQLAKTKEKISVIANRLPNHFLRSHRSFIVNQNKITAFNKESISLDQIQIPISRSYKKEIFNTLDKIDKTK